MKTSDVEYLNSRYPHYIVQTRENFWRNFLLLALDSSAFTFAIAMFSQDTILPYFVTRLTSNAVLVGLVPAVYFLGYYTPQLFGAYLASRRTRRKPMILTIIFTQRLGLLLIALSAQSAGVLPPEASLGLFFFAFLFFSLLNGLIGPAYSDFISKHIITLRGFFYGITFAVSGGVGFLASMVARAALDGLPYPENLQRVFLLGFLCSFVSPFIVMGLRETPLPYANPPDPLGVFFRKIPGLLREQNDFVRYLFARSVLGLGVMGNAFYALYAIGRFDLSEGALGLFTMSILLGQSLCSLAWGWVGQRYGYRAVLLMAGGFVAAEAVLALAFPAPWAFYLIVFLVGGVYSAVAISDPNFVFEIVPPHETSRFIGIANTLLAPVAVLAPLIGGSLVQGFGYPALFIAVLCAALLALVLLARFTPEPRRVRKIQGSVEP
jgi:MFS family permease